MKTPIIAIKVDVDTYSGTREGVPRLLEMLDLLGIKATFYFSMGPDNSGKAIRRIFTRKGFLKKMIRTKAPAMYGVKTLLYGTILPAPQIAEAFPEILQSVYSRGHEVGIHCWDHVHWHDKLPEMPIDKVQVELDKASRLFFETFHFRAETTAAPGWTVSPASLQVQDAMSLKYCSDSRGCSPFYPVINGRRYSTLQIPTTLPTMDELLGMDGISPRTINDHYLALIRPGLNVHTIHAELEGGGMADVFMDLSQRLQKADARYLTLSQAAEAAKVTTPPDCELVMKDIPGRAGLVAVQVIP